MSLTASVRRFGHFADRFAGCFSRQPQRAVASQYLEGLFTRIDERDSEEEIGECYSLLVLLCQIRSCTDFNASMRLR